MIVHNSAVTYPIHIFGKDNLLAVLSEVPLPPFASLEVAKAVASWAKSLKASVVVGVTGAPSKERDESHGDGKPTVVGAGNTESALALLKSSGASALEDGVLTGFYAEPPQALQLGGTERDNPARGVAHSVPGPGGRRVGAGGPSQDFSRSRSTPNLSWLSPRR